MESNKKTEQERSTLAEQLLDRVMEEMLALLNRTPCEACGKRRVASTDVTNILKFLKDNGFEVKRGEEKDALDRLVEERNRQALLPKDNTVN